MQADSAVTAQGRIQMAFALKDSVCQWSSLHGWHAQGVLPCHSATHRLRSHSLLWMLRTSPSSSHDGPRSTPSYCDDDGTLPSAQDETHSSRGSGDAPETQLRTDSNVSSGGSSGSPGDGRMSAQPTPAQPRRRAQAGAGPAAAASTLLPRTLAGQPAPPWPSLPGGSADPLLAIPGGQQPLVLLPPGAGSPARFSAAANRNSPDGRDAEAASTGTVSPQMVQPAAASSAFRSWASATPQTLLAALPFYLMPHDVG
jgi:hypothetical protein